MEKSINKQGAVTSCTKWSSQKKDSLHPFLDRPDSLIIALALPVTACVPSHSLCPQPLSEELSYKGPHKSYKFYRLYSSSVQGHFTILSSSEALRKRGSARALNSSSFLSASFCQAFRTHHISKQHPVHVSAVFVSRTQICQFARGIRVCRLKM